MENHNKPASHAKRPSAASAGPIHAQDARLAGVSPANRQQKSGHEHPAEEQAAARSRANMVSFSPLRPNESDGERRSRVEAVVDRMIAIQPCHDDPDGSYTGRPIIEGEKPVQDVDDL